MTKEPPSGPNSKSEPESRPRDSLPDQAKNNRGLGTELYNMIRPEDRGEDFVFEYSGEFPKPPIFD
jgi:hypothetical protein